MEPDIPQAFIQVAKCFAVDILGGGKILTGLCTSSGQLLEFVDRKVVDSLDLDREADDLMIFTSYNPIQKYYLVRSNQQLLVIKRQKPLSIIKTYENVTRVQIEDRLMLGRPQTVIWMQGDREPIVTDFVGQLHAEVPQPVPQLTSGLSGKLHEMTLRLAKARKLLQEKRSARVRALYQLTPHLGNTNTQPQGDEKVLAWGPPFPLQDQVKQPPLRLSQAWRRVHNGKWVIGVPVFNTSDTSVEDVRLRLQVDSGAGQELRYETTAAGRQWCWPGA
uniref:Uncharacterized protein n=1 Tax=Homalodisca liturata TaxID=320908 RepID=A0A1B6ICM1_9HEMI